MKQPDMDLDDREKKKDHLVRISLLGRMFKWEKSVLYWALALILIEERDSH